MGKEIVENRVKKRIKLIISYDGTNYCGWQIQINGITVEEVINRELSRLLNEDIAVIGASRTDSGVHSLGNVAVFDTYSRIPPEKMCFAINQKIFVWNIQKKYHWIFIQDTVTAQRHMSTKY